MENELLYNELYEKTQDCGRAQFVKLLMEKERKNRELKQQLKQKENITNKIKDCVEEFLCSEYYCSQGLELHDFCVKVLENLDNKGSDE